MYRTPIRTRVGNNLQNLIDGVLIKLILIAEAISRYRGGVTQPEAIQRDMAAEVVKLLVELHNSKTWQLLVKACGEKPGSAGVVGLNIMTNIGAFSNFAAAAVELELEGASEKIAFVQSNGRLMVAIVENVKHENHKRVLVVPFPEPRELRT